MKFKIFMAVFLIHHFVLDSYNQQQVAKIQQQISNNQKINASRFDLRGLGTLFQGANFSNAQLSGALFNQISSTPIPSGSLVQVASQASDLTGAIFSNAVCISTGFAGANLTNAKFDGANVQDADFSGATLTGVDLDTMQNATTALFVNAIMPDGKKATGDSWTSPSGKVYPIHSATTQSVAPSDIVKNSKPAGS